ncbi:MAG: DUF3017 domain-containing protein [Frankiaceae bacterium]|nr:DUF3017 domain-containing protein [Frankiaceae bacterium]
MKQLPTLTVLALIVAGLLVGALASDVGGTPGWKVGGFIIGLALLLAAGLRLTLRERQAGFLVVRSRGFDAAVLLTLGFALVALANTIPEGGG